MGKVDIKTSFDPEVMLVEEARQVVKRDSVQAIYNAVTKGKINYGYVLGMKVIIDDDAWDDYVEECELRDRLAGK